MDEKIITQSDKETKEFGHNFAKKIKKGDVILLYGDLGAGKTTFTQGLAKGLGIKDRILSPTFVIHRVHSITGNGGSLNHIDLYRIENPTGIDSLGLSELFDDPDAVTLIEWADRLKDFNPTRGYKIKLNYLDKDKREIIITEINKD
jgi:tRNA threonylcarbamoyladenosine biosynthesis protein TsaE